MDKLIDEIANEIVKRAQPIIASDVVPIEVILMGAVKSAMIEYAQRSATPDYAAGKNAAATNEDIDTGLGHTKAQDNLPVAAAPTPRTDFASCYGAYVTKDNPMVPSKLARQL